MKAKFLWGTVAVALLAVVVSGCGISVVGNGGGNKVSSSNVSIEKDKAKEWILN
jgi:hypothetical protein